MRIALVLSQRLRLLMPPATSSRFSYSPQNDGHNLKRCFTQQALATARKSSAEDHYRRPTSPSNSNQRPEKIPRLEGELSPSASSGKYTSHPQFDSLSPSRSRKTASLPSTHVPSGVSLASRLDVLKPSSPSQSRPRRKGKGKAEPRSSVPDLELPVHDEVYISEQHRMRYGNGPPVKDAHLENPKSPVANFCSSTFDSMPQYETAAYINPHTSRRIFRTTIKLGLDPPIVAVGDAEDKRVSERLAALSCLYQLHEAGMFTKPSKPSEQPVQVETSVTLSDSSVVNYERARNFMDFYCRRYRFRKPDIDFEMAKGKQSSWEAFMSVSGRRIGVGAGPNKKQAQIQCYLDVTQYLEGCDPELWKAFVEAEKSGKELGLANPVYFQVSSALDGEIRDVYAASKKSYLYQNSPTVRRDSARSKSATLDNNASLGRPSFPRIIPPGALADKSNLLLQRRKEYLASESLRKMRETRMFLPIHTRAEELMKEIREHDVVICMAATGSGKTTQIPQMLLDEQIDAGMGAQCNILCTQPRRLAALSVADRVAKERGEVVGRGAIGYNVRFESKLPEEHGSVTFCTTGVLLKRLQSALSEGGLAQAKMDEITHIIVDEVHERDVDTDLLLVVLKRLLADRKARGMPLKIVLMSATIDPTLFQEYFIDDGGRRASVIEIPGRTFPVKKYFLDDFLDDMKSNPRTGWALQDNLVQQFLATEGVDASSSRVERRIPGQESSKTSDDFLEIPSPLVALTISHVLQKSDSGHVLVFLPGMDEILAVQRTLLDGRMDLNFRDTSKYSIHLLHSTIPLAEQQIVFEPPPEGTRRIILATNIAETSVTIPDVVYVVDTAKVKEMRYDPSKHMSSLVSAWVGSSNLNQRAGRAGRHRPGEYFGIISRRRADTLHPYQTVEMKRVDLSNVVMHVKALNFPGMEVEGVLAAAIEPPAADRVASAIKSLQMVGALDDDKSLTSLGRVLLQLPVDAQLGRLVLYGSFFRCLDGALSLAAILSNRDPFLSPMHAKQEADEAKRRWSPDGFRSDALTTLQAYNAWEELQSTGQYNAANRFCSDNFLSKPTLLLIQKIRRHLLLSLYNAGVIDVSAGGNVKSMGRAGGVVPPELDVNSNSLPVLSALIAIASQPKFAIRSGEKTYRTAQDKITFIHPSSVNHRKKNVSVLGDHTGEKQLYAFWEKRQNLTTGGTSPNTFLVNTTRLDPMTYMLFGAYEINATERGLECDGWLPITGNVDALDDIQRLKTIMEACMLRVFEGIIEGRRLRKSQGQPLSQPVVLEGESESVDDDFDEMKDLSLSQQEIKDLDYLTRDIVRILQRFSDEHLATRSQQSSRPATPMGSPPFSSSRLSNLGSSSGRSTPYNPGSTYNSRPNMPSRLRRF